MPGQLFDVQTYAIHDGPGIRTTVFLQGCPLRCDWCHNPESWEVPATPGPEIAARELVDRLLLDRAFFENSGGGVTFSGGEPTRQSEFLLEALALLKEHGVHTAIETCGHFRSSLCEPLADRVDLFLFDLKHADPDRHKEGTGVGNALIFKNLERLVSLVGTERIVPRLPLVPGFNESPDAVRSLLDLLEELGFRGEVHLMPHHDWASFKHEQLGLEFRDRGKLDPSVRDRTLALFEGRELQAVWGGGA